MRRVILGLMAMMFCVAAIAADADKPGDKPTPTPTRVSIFSTSTDWSAVTGLPWAQYEGNFSPDKKLIGPQGLVLFFLDSFPCYGEADSVRVWISPRGQVDGRLRLVCVHAPKTVYFAWRHAKKDAIQTTTTGILECPVAGDREITVDMAKCVRGKNWDDFK